MQTNRIAQRSLKQPRDRYKSACRLLFIDAAGECVWRQIHNWTVFVLV